MAAATEIRDPTDDAFAAQLRGFGPIGLIAVAGILLGNLLFAPLSAILVLVWRWRSRTPWREIGYVKPTSWLSGLVLGAAIGVALKVTMKAVVMPLLGADPVNRTYHYLAGNDAALPGAIFTMIVIAGWGEETVFRGWMFERLSKVLGAGAPAKALIVVLTTAVFAAAHYPDQGLPGVQQAAIVGLGYAAAYALTGRLWSVMCAHAAFDLTALAMIYFNVEAAFARLIFH